MALRPSPRGGVGTEGTAKINVSLSNISKPFKLSGTLASPSLGISATRTASIVGRALFLPGGIPSLFISGSVGGQNPCVEAVKKAKEHASGTQTTSGGQAAKNGSEAKKKEGLGTKIKNLFSKPKE